MKQLNATEFDRLAHLELADEPGTYSIELPAEWSSLVGIHGGYLASLAVVAAERTIADRSVRTVTTSFLRAAPAGPALVRVTEQRRSRSISTVVAEVIQDGRPITSTRLTLVSEASGRAGVEWRAREPIPLPAPVDCVPLEPPGRVIHFERAEGLIDPSSLPFTDGPRAMVRGYVRPLEPRPIDAAWLAMASDWFPPPAFVRLAPPVGGISIDLTTHVHETLPTLGQDDWLAASFEITTSVGGLATEHGRITTMDGFVVAESFQTRWMVPR